MNFVIYLKKLDWFLIGAVIVLAFFSLGAIYSSGIAKNNYENFYKQLIFFVIGLIIMVVFSFFDYKILRNNPYLILILYFICILLLAGLYVFAPEIRGTKGWYKIGFLNFDPIEPTKIIVLILLAKYFSMRHIEIYKFRHVILSGIYILIPVILIFIKPDLGGVIVLLSAWLSILIASGIKIKHFFILFLFFILTVVLIWSFLLKDYQKERVISFIFPYDVLGSAWSQIQTKISIGSGGIFGRGIGKDSQVQYGFLPEPHTDFIFSAISQQWGLLGIIILFSTYGLLIWRILDIAIMAQSNFSRLFAIGFAATLIIQFVINIGMNLTMLPVVGLYLPFVSYGGSGLVGNFIGLGILQSIKIKK